MRKTLALMTVVLAFGLTAGMDAEAKRLGGGKSSGMQRQSVTAPSSAGGTSAPGAPAQAAPAAGTAAAAAAPAAAAAKRSWMGPLAGIAAGLGIAALASHFGFGEALANMLTFALVAMAVMALVGFLLRKRAAGQAGAYAGAAAGAAGNFNRVPPAQDVAFRDVAQPAGSGSMIGSRLAGGTVGGTGGGQTPGVGQIPAGFDVAAFERTAREQFMTLQAANDAGDLVRLRDVLSPEMFDIVKVEVAERAGATQKTEVFGLQAQVLDVAEEADRYVVSVRFTGSVREQSDAMPEDLDEVWHLAKPKAGMGGWVIAGIQQAA